MRYLLSIFSIFIVLIACSSKNPDCDPVYNFKDQTSYHVSATLNTPEGILLDSSGLPINPKLVDRLTIEVENCLIQQFGNPPTLPENVKLAGDCPDKYVRVPIKRQCITVKVANNWFLSENEFSGTKQQLLPYIAGYGDCGKNFTPGPCYWRAGIQDNLTIVTTPSFYLYKEPLLKITTGCNNPWASSELSTCMVPTTDALGDGTGP